MRINTVLFLTDRVPVDAGGSEVVRFEFVPPSVGEYQISLRGAGQTEDAVTGSITVEVPPEPARFSFSSLQITPVEPLAADDVNIEFLLSNEGQLPGVITVELLINETVADTLGNVDVDADTTLPLSFRIEAPAAAGIYTVRLVGTVVQGDRLVEDLTGTFRVAEEGELRLVSVVPIPGEVAPGETLTIAVQVVNDFGQTLSRELVLKVDGVPITTRVVTVGANQTVTETFEFAAPVGVGRHELEIDGIRQIFEVRPIPEAVLNLIPPLVIFPDTAAPGEPVSVRAPVRNSGDEGGATDVILRVNGQEEERQRITVPAGDDVAVTFSVTRNAEGSYNVEAAAPNAVDVKTLTGTFTVALVQPILNLVAPLDISPSQVRPGDPVTVTARIRNTGGGNGQTDVVLRVDGAEESRQNVRVPAEQDVTVTFTVRRDAVRSYKVEVEAVEAADVKVLRGTFSVSDFANLVLENLRVEPDRVDSGEPVTISVDVTNVGGRTGTRTVVLNVDDEDIEGKSERVTVQPGETVTVSFTHVERKVGTHDVAVDGLTITFDVTKPVPLGVIIPLLIIFSLVVLGLSLLAYVRARRGGAPAVGI